VLSAVTVRLITVTSGHVVGVGENAIYLSCYWNFPNGMIHFEDTNVGGRNMCNWILKE
jgi:hypothetical protein